MNGKQYRVSVSRHEDILKILISGRTTERTAVEIAQAVLLAVEEHKPEKVLIDCRPLEGRLSMAATYYHVRKYQVPSHFAQRTAIIERPENEGYYSFHETTSANVGVYMKYFTDVQDAMEWLSQ